VRAGTRLLGSNAVASHQAGWWLVRWDFALAMRPHLLAARLRDAFEFGRPRS